VRVTLRKLKSNHNNLSRDVYTGTVSELPKVGESFLMQTNESGLLMTTHVASYEKNFENKTITFRTKNSEYELEITQ
jgi:hypothetical protein